MNVACAKNRRTFPYPYAHIWTARVLTLACHREPPPAVAPHRKNAADPNPVTALNTSDAGVVGTPPLLRPASPVHRITCVSAHIFILHTMESRVQRVARDTRSGLLQLLSSTHTVSFDRPDPAKGVHGNGTALSE